MKKRAWIGLLLLFVAWIALTLVYNVTPVIRGNAVAEKFFKNLVDEDYTAAAQYIEGRNREEWINSLSQLAAEEISLTRYKDLKVSLNDNAIRGGTTVSLVRNGEQKEYRIWISFGGSRFSPLISNLQYIVSDALNEEALDKWVRAINRPSESGDVSK